MLARVLAVLLSVAGFAAPASAKEGRFSSPGGRAIYGPEERFGDVIDTTTRRFIVEAVFGYAPEGNVGANIGWLLPYVDGLELYFGVGQQTNPSSQVVATLRYFPPLGELRAYVAIGYSLQILTALGTSNHSIFAEIGRKWRLQPTLHLTIGIGARYIAAITVHDSSILSTSRVEPSFLEAELDDVGRFAPILSIRASRAF